MSNSKMLSQDEMDMATKVQAFYAKHPNLKTKGVVPIFVLAGMQSAGKSKFLSTFALRAIGGAIRSGLGTRCPVVYVFENSLVESYQIGMSGETLSDISLEHISQYITDHMERLDKLNEFSDHALMVVVRNPEVVPFSVIDLAGLLAKSNHPDNDKISAMIQKYTKEKNCVPIVLLTPHTNDLTYTTEDANRLKAAIGNAQAIKRSVVCVTKVDIIRDLDLAALNGMSNTIEAAGFTNGIVFMSLLPHRLQTNGHAMFTTLNDNSPWIDLNAYMCGFKMIEAQAIDEFKQRLGTPAETAHLKLGMPEAQAYFRTVLGNSVRSNIHTVRIDFDGQDALLAQQYLNMVRPPSSNPKDFHKVAREFVMDVCEVLRRIANTRMDTDNAFELVESLRLTFDEDLQEFLKCPKSGGVVPEFASQEVIDMISLDKNHDLYKGLVDRYSGSAAVNRVLMVFGFWLMTNKLKDYDVADIMQRAEMIDENSVRGVSINYAMKKMVHELLGCFAPQIEVVCNWIINIFTRAYHPAVNSVLKSHTKYERYPALMKYLIFELETRYGTFFDGLKNDAVRSISHIATVLFATLQVGLVESIIRLLGCSGIGKLKEVMQPVTAMDERVQVARKGAQETGKRFAKAKDSFLAKVPGMTPAAKKLSDIIDKNEKNDHVLPDTLDFFAALSDATVGDFVCGNTLILRGVSTRSDVERLLGQYNDAAKSLARICFGICVHLFTSIVGSSVVVPAKQVDNDIQKHMLNVLGKIEHDKATLAELERPDPTKGDRMEQLIQSLAELADWGAGLTSQDRLDKINKRKTRLETDIVNLRVIEAQLKAANPTPTVASQIDDDIEQLNLGVDSSDLSGERTATDWINLIRRLQEDKEEILMQLRMSNERNAQLESEAGNPPPRQPTKTPQPVVTPTTHMHPDIASTSGAPLAVRSVGLENFGNTCYLNSVLQCLFATEYLTNVMTNRGAVINNDVEVAKAYSDLTQLMTLGKHSCVSPQPLVRAMNEKFAQWFNVYEQQDAHEVLLALYNQINDGLNAFQGSAPEISVARHPDNAVMAAQYWRQFTDQNKSALINSNYGLKMVTITCSLCNDPQVSFEAYQTLSLPVVPRGNGTQLTMLDCIEDYSDCATVDTYCCPGCKKDTTATRVCELWSVPDVLVLHLHRLQQTPDGNNGNVNFNKVTDPIVVPIDRLDLDPYVVGQGGIIRLDAPNEFELYAVVHHLGENMNNGHYTATCRNTLDKNWYNFNDRVVQLTDITTMDTKTAYILFYKRSQGSRYQSGILNKHSQGGGGGGHKKKGAKRAN